MGCRLGGANFLSRQGSHSTALERGRQSQQHAAHLRGIHVRAQPNRFTVKVPSRKIRCISVNARGVIQRGFEALREGNMGIDERSGIPTWEVRRES